MSDGRRVYLKRKCKKPHNAKVHSILMQNASEKMSHDNQRVDTRNARKFQSLARHATLYQAIFAMKLSGYLLTMNFRASSKRSNPMPKPMGKNQNSTGTVDVPKTVWNLGT